MATIKYAEDILRKDSPRVEITMHLNTAYFYFLYPSTLDRSNIYKVSIELTEYAVVDGVPDFDNPLSNQLVDFNPRWSVYVEDSSTIPRHHAYKYLNNNWYKIKFMYTYIPALPEDGGNTFYSLPAEYYIDNTRPKIFKNALTPYITGKLRDELQKRKSVNLWWEAEAQEPEVMDAVTTSGTNVFKQIQAVNPTDELHPYQLTIPEPDYQTILNSLIEDTEVAKVVWTYYNGVPPYYGEMPLDFLYNLEPYTIYIRGNMVSLSMPYKLQEDL